MNLPQRNAEVEDETVKERGESREEVEDANSDKDGESAAPATKSNQPSGEQGGDANSGQVDGDKDAVSSNDKDDDDEPDQRKQDDELYLFDHLQIRQYLQKIQEKEKELHGLRMVMFFNYSFFFYKHYLFSSLFMRL